MSITVDCHFWDPDIPTPDLQYTYTEIATDITIRKPNLTTQTLSTILVALEKQRTDYLCSHSLPDIFDTIMDLINQWTDPDSPWRRIAHDILPPITGYSPQMIEEWGFNIFLQTLDPRDLPLTGRLDPHQYRQFTPYSSGYVKTSGKTPAYYDNDHPKLIGHICAGNIVGLPAVEMIMDKLIDAATWIKPSTEEPVFAALFAQSMENLDPDLAHTIAVLPLDSTQTDLNEFLFYHSDLVRATGGEIARHGLTKIADSCKRPLAGHWHKFSFIAIARDYLADRSLLAARLAALDVSAWDQQGCFSPQVILVEKGGQTSPRQFAELLANELQAMLMVLPKGAKAGKISILEGYQEAMKKQIFGSPIHIFSSQSHDYLVVYDETTDPVEPSPQFRAITVKPVNDINEIPELIRPLHRFLQTIGVAIPMERLLPFADVMGACGATNIRVLGEMTLQKSWEPWDGRFPLEELLRDDGSSWMSISFTDMDAALQSSMVRLQSLKKGS
jgi:hypothetical protein